MKQSWVKIIRQERGQIEAMIEEEQKRPNPDFSRIAALRQEVLALNRQLERVIDG